MTIEYIPNPNAKAQALGAIFAATEETFELDIKPEAVRTSPVTPEGLARNLAMGKKGVAAYGTGHNRQSIDVEVALQSDGPHAELFTQSGYGGFLEVGTSKMSAQPYLWPAFQKFVRKIVDRARSNMNG